MENLDEIKIHLKKTTIGNIPDLISIEKKLTDLKTYSAMTNEKEWLDEISKENSVVYLIIKDDEVVGDVSYEIKDNVAHITGLAVSPEFQGKGIGKKTIQLILEELKDINTIELATHPDNPALKLYLSLGFTIQSEKEDYYGDGEPRLILVKNK